MSSRPSPTEIDHQIESGIVGADDIEGASATLVELRDASWAIRHDRLRTAAEVECWPVSTRPSAAIAGYLAVQQALVGARSARGARPRLAGLHLFVWDHGLDDPIPRCVLVGATPIRCSRPVRWVVEGCLSFVYKAAAEIGELGDNTSVLRRSIATDAAAPARWPRPSARRVLGHTRWASVGIISEANGHPLNSEEIERPADDAGPYVVAALNGDVDNHADIKVAHGLRIPGRSRPTPR